MARQNFVLKMLQEKGEVVWKPIGSSMTPKIHSGDEVKVIICPPHGFRVGDVVYAKVKGNYYLHLLTAIDTSGGSGYNARYQISNNHGHVNGWTDAKNMFGICVQVKEKILLTDKQLSERLRESALDWSQEGEPAPSVLAWGTDKR
jgi:hypothetical protein